MPEAAAGTPGVSASVRYGFFALILTQALHSLEEYRGRLYDVFPPARVVSGLISQDRERGFIIFNVALLAFGVWCAVWPVRTRWPSAPAFIWTWIAIELLNGIGHPAWSLLTRAYTPGVATAPALLIIALSLAWQLPRGAVDRRSGRMRDEV